MISACETSYHFITVQMQALAVPQQMSAAFLNQRNDESDRRYMYYPMTKYTRICEGSNWLTNLLIGYRIRLNQLRSISIQYLNKVVIVISRFGFESSVLVLILSVP